MILCIPPRGMVTFSKKVNEKRGKRGKYEICDESLDEEFFENCKKFGLKNVINLSSKALR
jgi:hypothetical protein